MLPKAAQARLGLLQTTGKEKERRGCRGQLFEIPETARGAEWAVVVDDAATGEDGIVGGELPLEDRFRLGDGEDAQVEIDLVKGERLFVEDLGIAIRGGIGA